MTTLREAAQQALEAMTGAVDELPHAGYLKDAITALLAALAEPEQEPVARVAGVQCRDGRILTYIDKHLPLNTPLYTHPPQRKPLTNEEIALIDWESLKTRKDCVRAVERAHGIGGEA